MYWALTTDLVDPRGHEFEQVLGDIETLNQWARAGRLEVTAISLAAYPFVQEDYALLPHGASIGSGYGPIEEAPLLLRRQPILDVLVLEDLLQASPALVLAHDVPSDVLLRGAALEEEREEVLEHGHETRLYPGR